MESEAALRLGSVNNLKNLDCTNTSSQLSEQWFIEQNTFNNTSTNYSNVKNIPTLFEEIVETFGNKIAVEVNGQQYTYNELNNKSNQLANYLQGFGVGPNILVAITLEHSFELIVAILAIVKAGGAYIPIDIHEATNRMLVILEGSNPKKIIVNDSMHNSLLKNASEAIKDKMININDFFKSKAKAKDKNNQNPICLSTCDDLINVIYTSGTTGAPKGCMIPQKAVLRVVKNPSYINIKSSDIIAQIANVSFDILTFEIWGALLNGATLFIIPSPNLLSTSEFANLVKDNNVTIMVITVSLLNLIVKNRPDAFDKLNYLLFGGEKANPEIIKILLKRKKQYKLNNLHLINAYGPTEATVFALSFLVERITDIRKNVPIGKPINNTKAYVLDADLNCVPPGVHGELYLGGESLALGYFNSSEQTKKLFVDNPFVPGEKIYKTGDLVYWQPEVGVVFLDRIDSQLKINGFRVELNEIETCIIKQNSILQAAVTVEKNLQIRKEIVAYVVFQDSVNDYASFIKHLKDSLPSYMLPQKIIRISKIPLTPNGKLDRQQLIKAKGENILKEKCHHLPTNGIEKIILEVWQAIMGMNQISITQNFFDLGGNSLMLSEANVLINQKLIKNEINTEINIIEMLTYPTISLLSNYIIEKANNKSDNKIEATKLSNDRGNKQRKILMARKLSHLAVQK